MKKFKKPEFNCTKCGLFCRRLDLVHPEFDRGDRTYKYLDEDTKLCTIYETRPNFCSKAR